MEGAVGRLNPLLRWRRSLASRVTVLTAAVVAIVIVVVALSAFLVVRNQMRSSLDSSLVQRAHAAAGLYQADFNGNIVIPRWVLGAGDVRIATIDANGEVSLPATDTDKFPRLGSEEIAVARGQSDESLRTLNVNGEHYRVATVPMQRGIALVVAQSLDSQQDLLTRLGVIMFFVGLVGVGGAGFAGWAVASGSLRPVRRLTSDVERIARTEDLSPIPVDGDDEVARLAGSFNEMLVALAASRDRQKQLVQDASHELRTPLTSMRTNIDLLTQADASLSSEQRGELLTDIHAQMVEMSALIADLVQLARDETPAANIEPVDISEVLEDAIDRVKRRGPDIEWDIALDPWVATADAPQLERAFTNLLDNAVKWSPAGATVHVALHAGTVTVDDEGSGISDEDLPHVFERFYRSTESRSMPGSGLGLSIVAQVIDHAGGTVTAGKSPYGGARFTVSLPQR